MQSWTLWVAMYEKENKMHNYCQQKNQTGVTFRWRLARYTYKIKHELQTSTGADTAID